MPFRVLTLLLAVAAPALVGWLDREVLALALAGDAPPVALVPVALKAALASAAVVALARMVAGRMRPVTIALVFTAALVGWLASKPLEGLLRGGGPAGGPAAASATAQPPPVEAAIAAAPLVTVRVRESRASPVEPELVVNGRTAAARAVSLRAETAGRIVATPVAKGGTVAAGAVLLRIDEQDRPAQVLKGEARRAQRELEYEAARRLGERQFQAETKVAEMRAELEESRADLAEARLDLARTEVRAPFAAVLERRPVEVGDYVAPGTEVAHLVEQDPFLVVGDAPEAVAGRFRAGQAGGARLADGAEVLGRIRYVASVADEGTRTFRVELEVANPEGDLFRSGMSARLVVREPAVPAHEISAAALVLDEQGAVGVKAVDEAGVVRFHPARIVKGGAEALWLAGMPEDLRIITTGQGFVQVGQEVEAQAEAAEPPAGPEAVATGGGAGGTGT